MDRKISLLGLLLLVDYALGSCGICQSNYVACHSETTFSLCLDGIPSDAILTCPGDKVCTNQTTICVPKGDDLVIATCVTGCGICNSYQKVFSCLNEKTYAFCFGDTEPFYTAKGSCSDGYVCDLSSQAVCVKDTIAKPSCSASAGSPTTIDSTSSSTTQIPRDATTFCSDVAIAGTFKAEGDTTCTRYYICVNSRSGFKGYEYSCSNSNYFNPELNLCQRERPEYC